MVGGDDTAAALGAMIARLAAAGPLAVRQGALVVQAAGMQRTKVKSGTLRRSWRVEDSGTAGVYAARVGPTMIYARRIELGFKGADSLGRVYNQQPAAYVKPAYVESLPKIQVLVRSLFTKVITGGR